MRTRVVESCRVLRLSHTVDVLPALGVAASLAASPTDLESFVMRLALHNSQVGGA